MITIITIMVVLEYLQPLVKVQAKKNQISNLTKNLREMVKERVKNNLLLLI